jgi:hypothetical protein
VFHLLVRIERWVTQIGLYAVLAFVGAAVVVVFRAAALATLIVVHFLAIIVFFISRLAVVI